jgi:hypothetical protein
LEDERQHGRGNVYRHWIADTVGLKFATVLDERMESDRATLIAAAPKLLAALEHALPLLSGIYIGERLTATFQEAFSRAAHEAREAIREAKGES